jgi:hypothetical protein
MNKEQLIQTLIEADNKRARSKQTAIGVSQLGGCSKRVWLQLQGTPETNQVHRLPAIMGTAIHATIEAALMKSKARKDWLIEERVEIDGFPPATIDFYDKVNREVIDWKTITLKNVPYFVSKQKRWQIQTYGYLLTLAGHPVDTVSLIGVPRDGTEQDIVVHSEPYDEAVALEALAWLKDVESAPFAPAPEMSGKICSEYCPFFGELCQGIPKDLSGDVIADDVKARAAADYLTLGVEIKNLEAKQSAAKAELEGVSGVTIDGITVKWSEVAGRQTPDLDAIKAQLPFVPMKQGAPSFRLAVK